MLSLIYSFFTAFLIAVLVIPSIILIAKKHNLYDEPGERKIHQGRVPLLGGLAIFAATLIACTLWAAPYFEQYHLFILASLLILFFMGLRDDIMPLPASLKITAQAIAAFLVVFFCGLRLTGLHGLFDIYTVNPVTGLFLSIITILFFINAFNLIDGSDGLAAGLGCISSFTFGILFYVYKDFFMAVLSFTMTGALLGFLFYNFPPAKIFMGDTGSMTIGFTLSLFVIRFVELTKSGIGSDMLNPYYSPVIVLAILIVPIIDTLRVFILRILRRRSPFSPDRLHIHHILLNAGLSQRSVMLILCSVNVVFIFSAWLFRDLHPAGTFYALIISALLLTQIPVLYLRFRKKSQIA